MMEWKKNKPVQHTSRDVNRMKALIDNWNLMGVQTGKLLALDETGWEANKEIYPDNYVCRYCQQSTLTAKWSEISSCFSHRKCVEENEKLIKSKLGPLAEAPYGVIKDEPKQEETHDWTKRREFEQKLLEEQAKGPSVEQQRNPSPVSNVERCEYSYESYDNGKTIYRKKMGTGITELVEDWDWELQNVIDGKAVAIADTGWIPRGLTYGA